MARNAARASKDVDAILRQVKDAGRDHARPVRLFACACGRLIWPLLTDELGRPSVEVGERLADGQARWDDLRRVFRDFRVYQPPEGPVDRALHEAATALLMLFDYSIASAGIAARAARAVAFLVAHHDHMASQRELVLDIFGDPTRTDPFDPAWSIPAVADLARSIYQGRNFDAMPMLGDALEEAGCGSATVLDHCRVPGRHARGCWVVDASMGLRRPTPAVLPVSPG